MTTTINVRASDHDFARYKALVQSDWNKATLEGVLALLWKVLSHAPSPSEDHWQSVLQFPEENDAGLSLNVEIVERIRHLSEIFTEPSIPTIPANFSPKRTKAIALAEKTWAYLVLQALARLKGETGFFLDLQSLLFLAAVHYLLPQLDRQDARAERDCLLNAMYVHTLLAWRGQPAHLFYLQSAMIGYLGEDRRRLELLDLSLGVTPVSDHSYLTKANVYWSELMELGERKAAMSFLLNLSRVAPSSCLAEIQEMIEEMVAT